MTSVEERVAELEEAYKHVATKADLAQLGTSRRNEIPGAEASLSADIAKRWRRRSHRFTPPCKPPVGPSASASPSWLCPGMAGS